MKPKTKDHGASEVLSHIETIHVSQREDLRFDLRFVVYFALIFLIFDKIMTNNTTTLLLIWYVNEVENEMVFAINNGLAHDCGLDFMPG